MYFDTIRLLGRSSVDLRLKDQADPQARYILKNVDGLGPPDIDVSILQTPYQGGKYQGSRPQGREIIVRVGLQPDYKAGETVSELRVALYGLISSGPGSNASYVQLMQAVSQNVVVQARGYVKRFEIVPFSKDAEIQITFACVSPYLISPETIHPTVLTVGDRYRINNPGSAPVGFHAELKFTDALGSIDLQSAENSNYHMQIEGDFVNNSVLTIDTRPGFREVSKLQAGITTNLIDQLTGSSDWLMLLEGDNEFIPNWPFFVWQDLYFTPQYWGI